MSDFTESTISMIPIRKLEDASGNFYPLSVLESVITSHDIVINTNLGHYNAGDTIPEKTSLDEILGNIFSIDRHILKSKIDAVTLSSDTDRVPSSYLVGNLLKYGSAYVKKDEAVFDQQVESGKYVTGLKQIDGKVDYLYTRDMGEAAEMDVDERNIPEANLNHQNIVNDYTDSDEVLPSSRLTRTTLHYLSSELQKVAGSMKYIGEAVDDDSSNPMIQPSIIRFKDGTSINSFALGNIVTYKENQYIYIDGVWKIFTEYEIYTGSTVPTKQRKVAGDIVTSQDTSKLWLDTTVSHVVKTSNDIADITAIKSLLSKLQIGFNELYRIVMLGAVPGNVDDNYKSKLSQVDLSQDIDANIPNDIARSNTLTALKIFGDSYVGHGSKYTAIYNPTGTTKTAVTWSFNGCDETITAVTKAQALTYIENQPTGSTIIFEINGTRESYTDKSLATNRINSCSDTDSISYVTLYPHSITINGYVSCTKAEALDYINDVPAGETIGFKINGTIYEYTDKTEAIAMINSCSDEDQIAYIKKYHMTISDYNKQTCTINIPDVTMLEVCNNTAELVVTSTETGFTTISGTQTITVGGETPIPEEDGEPTLPAVCAKKDTVAKFAEAAFEGKLIDGELCFYTDQGKFAIYYNGKFYTLKSSSGDDEEALDVEKLKATPLEYLQFTDGTTTYKVYVDTNGEWQVVPYNANMPATTYGIGAVPGGSINDTFIGSTISINSAYIGGGDGTNLDKNCLVSHNFVELANASTVDVKLDGCILLYTKGSSTDVTGFNWKKLNLTGVLKAKSTFLIRGARCNSDNDSLIVVDKFDMEWKDDQGKLVSFELNNQSDSNGAAFFLCTGSYDSTLKELKLKGGYQTKLERNELKDLWSENTTAKDGYVDECGFSQISSYYVPFEGTGKSEATQLVTDTDFRKCLFIRWYMLDPSKAALKAYSARRTTIFWTYINLEAQTTRKGNSIQYYYNDLKKQKYEPKTTNEKKNFFTSQTIFDENAPNIVNITFGKQATETNDLSNHGKSNATRCFNWVSVGNFDEYVEYRKVYTDKGKVATSENLPSSGNSINDSYETLDNGNKYYWNGYQWNCTIAGSVNYEEDLIHNGDYYTVSGVKYIYLKNSWVVEDRKGDVNDQNNLPLTYDNEIGDSYLVTAKNTIYIWNGDEWIPENNLGTKSATSDLPAVIHNGDCYKVVKTDQYFVWNGDRWFESVNGWTRRPSITENDDSNTYSINAFIEYYKRFRWATPYGVWVTTHKAIINGLSEGNYEYRVRRFNDDSYTSEIMKFKVRNDRDITSFSFIQTSDQQGFNWMEYQAWKKASYMIDKKNHDTYDFTINTGDIAQSGNRPNEWLDYYDGKSYIKDKVEMYSVGNNDLCGRISSELTDGEDATSKYNHINSHRYFAFELDPLNSTCTITSSPTGNIYERIYNQFVAWTDSDNVSYITPIYSNYSFDYGIYHFVSINSENCQWSIRTYTDKYDTVTTESILRRFADACNAQIEKWFKKDLQLWKNVLTEPKDCSKCVVYMHHMPFTLATDDFMTKAATYRTNNGSALNIYDSLGSYRYARLFKKYGIRLILGGHKHTFTIPDSVYDCPDRMYKTRSQTYEDLPCGITDGANDNDLGDVNTTVNDCFDYVWNGWSWEPFVEVNESVSTESNLPSIGISNGAVYHVTENALNYVYLNNTWRKVIPYADDGVVSSYSNLPAATINNYGDIYFVTDTHRRYKSIGTNWKQVYNVTYKVFNRPTDGSIGSVYCVATSWTRKIKTSSGWTDLICQNYVSGEPVIGDIRITDSIQERYNGSSWENLNGTLDGDVTISTYDSLPTLETGKICNVCNTNNAIDYVYGYSHNGQNIWNIINRFTRKESVDTTLPPSDNSIGDVRTLLSTGIDNVWNGTEWNNDGYIQFIFKDTVSNYSNLSDILVKRQGDIYTVLNQNKNYFWSSDTNSWIEYSNNVDDMMISTDIIDTVATDKSGKISSKVVTPAAGKVPVIQVIYNGEVNTPTDLPNANGGNIAGDSYLYSFTENNELKIITYVWAGSEWIILTQPEKGTVSTLADLPISGVSIGDYYKVGTDPYDLYAVTSFNTSSEPIWSKIVNRGTIYRPQYLPSGSVHDYLNHTFKVANSGQFYIFLCNAGVYKWHIVYPKLARLKFVNRINAPTYVMSQATGYKLISNKELPASPSIKVNNVNYSCIPWVMNYFANGTQTKASENNLQHHPMYIKYTMNSNSVNFKVKQVRNIWNCGDSGADTPIFNFNDQLANLNDVLYFEHTLNNL